MISGSAIQGVADTIINLFVSATNDASVVVRSAGTKNAYGEMIGETETLTGFQILVVGEDKSSRNTGAGDTGPIEMEFIVKSDVVINEGDRIRWDGNDYLVTFIERLHISGVMVHHTGRMKKIHGN